MNHEFTFKFLTMPPINSELRRAISKVNAKWSGLTLQGAGDYELMCDLYLALVNAIGIANVEVTSIRIIPDSDEKEGAPRAIGLTDLPQREKHLIVSTGLNSNVAINMLANALGCDFECAALQVRTVGQAQFWAMSSEQIEHTVKQLAETLRDDPEARAFKIDV